MYCYNMTVRNKKEAELLTLERMIALYCRGKHGRRELCAGCRELLEYSSGRLRRCPHDPKPACRDCPAHCYGPEMRGRIKAVMRYAGPRMLLRHPWLAVRHLLKF